MVITALTLLAFAFGVRCLLSLSTRRDLLPDEFCGQIRRPGIDAVVE